MNEALPYQKKFVEKLKASIANHLSLAEELADLLNLSTDSIYRRLRCQSAFSVDEIGIIAEKFNVSLDGIFNLDQSRVSFNFNPLYQQSENFYKYLKWFSEYLTALAKIPGTKIIYAADDVPVLQNFNYPVLSAFKSFYWSKAVLNIDFFEGKKFNPDFVSNEILEINKKTYRAYSQLERIEIWTHETLNTTLKQVQFYWECNLFESVEQAILILNDIRKMLEQIQMDCEENQADDSPNRYTLYNSEVMIGNNSVYIIPGNETELKRVFLGYNTFNSISTYESHFVHETSLWMNNLIKKSMMISGSAEKQRIKFFNSMEERISALELYMKESETSAQN